MNLSITSLLARLALEQDTQLSALLNAAVTESKKSGDSLSVRLKPSIRKYTIQVSAKLGISASEFINILIEEGIRETLSSYQSRTALVIERFQLLMDAHGLKATDVATLLSPWNIDPSVLENRERTIEFLSPTLLAEIADWFNVNSAWLQGQYVTPKMPSANIGDWHAFAWDIYNKIINISFFELPRIVLVRDVLAPPVDIHSYDTLVSVCLITVKLKNGVPLRTVEYLGEQISYGGHEQRITDFLAFCGVLERKGLAMVMTLLADTTTLSLLSSGQVLPVMVVDKIFHSKTLAGWQIEELMPRWHPEKYATKEWLKKLMTCFD